MTSPYDLAVALRAADDLLGQACCLTLVKALDVDQTFRRLGADTSAGTLLRFDQLIHGAYDEQGRVLGRQLVGAAALEGWTLVLEPNGYACSDVTTLRHLSAATTAITLYHPPGAETDELSVTTDGRRTSRLEPDRDDRARCGLWGSSSVALVGRFSGVQLTAGLVGTLRYRTGSVETR